MVRETCPALDCENLVSHVCDCGKRRVRLCHSCAHPGDVPIDRARDLIEVEKKLRSLAAQEGLKVDSSTFRHESTGVIITLSGNMDI